MVCNIINLIKKLNVHTIAFVQGKKNPARNIPFNGPPAPVTRERDI